jgi:hypothetical protein
MFHQLALIAAPDFPLVDIAYAAGRVPRQRTTLYGMVGDLSSATAPGEGYAPSPACDSSIRSSERSPNGMSFGLFNPWREQRKI